MILIKKKFEFRVKGVGQIMGRGEKGMMKYKGWGLILFITGDDPVSLMFAGKHWPEERRG